MSLALYHELTFNVWIFQALRASSQSSEENFCLINKNVQNKATGFSASPSSSRENLGPNVPTNKMSLQIQVSPHQKASFPASPRVDRYDVIR